MQYESSFPVLCIQPEHQGYLSHSRSVIKFSASLLFFFVGCVLPRLTNTRSPDMSSLIFEQWSVFPWSFPKQFLWWNCQVLASATSKQTSASCNFCMTWLCFLWNAFLCSLPVILFFIWIDNWYYNFSPTVVPWIKAVLLWGSISPRVLQGFIWWLWEPRDSSLLLHGQSRPYLIFLKSGMSWWLIMTLYGHRVWAELGQHF